MNLSVGIDEVGRGSWAGPLVAGAVMLNKPIDGLKDSKKLTFSQRKSLNEIINQSALFVGLGWVTAGQVDALGLTAAVKLAMEKAIKGLKEKYTEIIIDGNFNYLEEYSGS